MISKKKVQKKKKPRRPKVFRENDFEIKDSSIPKIGKGLFTKNDLIKGDTVGYYTGKVISDDDAESPKYVESKYLLWICKDYWIWGEGRWANYTRFINHSEKKPNLLLVTSTRWKTARFKVIRKVKAGEELFFDYGKEYWDNIDLKPKEKKK